MRLHTLLLALLLLLAFATDAGATGPDASVPGSVLRISVVSRAHFSFTVDVSNPTAAPVTFDATGLYFVPASPSDPPQRLGVVTPGRRTEVAAESPSGVTIPAYQTVHVTLTAYCLDVGRHSPSDDTPYRLADQRLPPKLSEALSFAVHSIPAGSAASRSSLTQSAVWRIRGEMPTALIGETHPSR